MNNRQNNRRRGRNPNPRQSGGGRGADPQNRIDNRTRGNAVQLHEKYRNMARDAQMKGDRVEAEYWWQFADHYYRVVADQRARAEERHGGGRSQRDEWRQQAEDDEDRPGASSRTNGRDDEDESDWRSEARQQNGRDSNGSDHQQGGRQNRGESDDDALGGNTEGEDSAPARPTRRARRTEPAEQASGEEAPRPRSRRPRTVEANGDADDEGAKAQLDSEILPPSLTDSEKPRRRGRLPKAKPEEGTEAA